MVLASPVIRLMLINRKLLESTNFRQAEQNFVVNAIISHGTLFHSRARSLYLYRCVYGGITYRNRTSAAMRRNCTTVQSREHSYTTVE